MVEPVIIGDCSYIGFERFAYIYAIRARYGEKPIVYIGSTINPIKQRIRCHFADVRRGSMLPIHKWMRFNKLKFDVHCLEIVSESKKEEREKYFISILKPSLNLTDGGKGMSGHKFAGTEHARKIGAKLKTGKTFHCLRCGESFWRKQKDILKNHNKYCSRNCSNRRKHEVA